MNGTLLIRDFKKESDGIWTGREHRIFAKPTNNLKTGQVEKLFMIR